ncbi:MAG: hypothetical protein LC101_04550 [Flavobacteriales bacterium]|nr:hypothetical protein [Flavobacteriales bacterium]
MEDDGGDVSSRIEAMTVGDSIVLPLHIESGSTIRKAYVFTYEVGYPNAFQTIFVNGMEYIFDSSSKKIMKSLHPNNIFFQKPDYKDITSNLNTNIDTIRSDTIV